VQHFLKMKSSCGRYVRFLVNVEPDEPVDVSDVDDDLPVSRQDGEAAASRLHARPVLLRLTQNLRKMTHSQKTVKLCPLTQKLLVWLVSRKFCIWVGSLKIGFVVLYQGMKLVVEQTNVVAQTVA
jgi:hypothetical protein